jgi:regulator of sirC expression with transglutaminase-like and TPR domain
MNEVMDDREGIPITLSVLFMELARRLDLNVSGLGLPGHFIAMYKNDSAESPKEILIDAFAGKIVNRKQASDIIGYNLKERDFVPASKRDIITRMIRNLLHMSDEGNPDSRILYINAILAIDPTDRYTRAMRAMHYYINGNYMDAMNDIDTLISENPNSPELTPLLEIRNRLMEKRIK